MVFKCYIWGLPWKNYGISIFFQSQKWIRLVIKQLLPNNSWYWWLYQSSKVKNCDISKWQKCDLDRSSPEVFMCIVTMQSETTTTKAVSAWTTTHALWRHESCRESDHQNKVPQLQPPGCVLSHTSLSWSASGAESSTTAMSFLTDLLKTRYFPKGPLLSKKGQQYRQWAKGPHPMGQGPKKVPKGHFWAI